MRTLPALVASLLLAAVAPGEVRAEFVMCLNGSGLTPAPKTVLPPRARLVYYSERGRAPRVTAKLDGAPVALTTTKADGSPFQLTLIDIDSARTGTLAVSIDGAKPVTYPVKARAPATPEKVPAVIGRVQRLLPLAGQHEQFDGLAIRLPAGTPAVLAAVKLRDDASAPWTQLLVPIVTPDDESRPMIRVGQFDCTPNFSLADLQRGVDIEVTLTLLDRSTRPVTGLAPHLKLPTLLPPNPRAPAVRVP